MYHAYFRGTHYEAGYRWGSLLLRHKNIISENIPFEITRERMAYASACLPVYEKYYHEITEEIQGIADGQQCDVRILQAVLFSMYSIPPACNCSCFAIASAEEILLGRNSDFLTEMEKQNLNVRYRMTAPAAHCICTDPDSGRCGGKHSPCGMQFRSDRNHYVTEP